MGIVFDKYLAALIILLGLLSYIIVTGFQKFAGAFFRSHSIRGLKKRLPDFTPREIERAIRYYIWPECQSIDPAQSQEAIHTVAIRKSLRTIVDKMIVQETIHKHFILLADNGMGKTSFLLNYFEYYLRHWRKSFKIKLFSLDSSGLEGSIKSIPAPKNTVLLLDGLDKDGQAVQDPTGRLYEIIELTREFHRVIITCQTRFFPNDAEISHEEELFRFKSAQERDEPKFPFYKLYLSSLSAEQVQSYLKKRFSILNKKRRKYAQDIIVKISNLSLRPMSLTYVDNLIDSGKSFKNCYQIYTEIVDAWLAREKKRFADINTVHEFLYKVAVEFYANLKNRGSEQMPSDEIESIAKRFNINLKKWPLSSHCLLDRDGEGNYKFAHRSIAEFLFAQRILQNHPEAFNVPVKDWSEQVKTFLLDGLGKRPWMFPVYFVPFTRKSWQIGEKGKTVEIKPFEISIYPVTNREYEEFDPSHRNKRNEYSDEDDQPVVNIT